MKTFYFKVLLRSRKIWRKSVSKDVYRSIKNKRKYVIYRTGTVQVLNLVHTCNKLVNKVFVYKTELVDNTSSIKRSLVGEESRTSPPMFVGIRRDNERRRSRQVWETPLPGTSQRPKGTSVKRRSISSS